MWLATRQPFLLYTTISFFYLVLSYHQYSMEYVKRREYMLTNDKMRFLLRHSIHIHCTHVRRMLRLWANKNIQKKKHSNWFLDSRKLLNTRAVLLDFIACKLAIYGERDRPINANELIRWNWYNLVELLNRNVCIYSAVTFSNQMNPKLGLQN